MRQEVINFLEKYNRMRSKQKLYFKTKEKPALIEAKQLEMENDIEADRLVKLLSKKPVMAAPQRADFKLCTVCKNNYTDHIYQGYPTCESCAHKIKANFHA